MQSACEVALLVSDLHLSLKPPVWRSAEENWLDTQARYLDELKQVQDDYGNIPILCAGDIFDKWYGAHQSSELINFALKHLPDNLFAIPGQHDLPNHNFDEIKRSAFWTLVESETIQLLNEDGSGCGECFSGRDGKNIRVIGVPYGFEIPEQTWSNDEVDELVVLLHHRYVWIDGHSYYSAPEELKLGKLYKEIKDYDVAVFGDNHLGFTKTIGRTTIHNCGTFMKRKSDEVHYKPCIGILYSDGTVKQHYLDTSKDKYLSVVSDTKETKPELDITDFIKELEKLGDSALDFSEAIKQYLQTNSVKESVKRVLLTAINERN